MPAGPVCPSPVVVVKVAAGFPTTIHPPCVSFTPALSEPVTVKWQNAGEPGAFTVMAPFTVFVIAEIVMFNEPEHAEAPSYESNTAFDSVTLPKPLVILGFNVTVPFAGTMIVSGFKSHSAAGAVPTVPGTTSKVALYGAKVCVADQLPDVDVIAVGELCASVYAVCVPLGVNPIAVSETCAAFTGSLFNTMIVKAVPVEFRAA